MSDPLTWSVSLGRWADSRVRVHVFLIFFAGLKLLSAAWEIQRPGLAILSTVGWLVLLLLALTAKIVVQIQTAERLGLEREEIRVWPLGDLGRPGLSAAERSGDAVAVAISGLLINLTLALSAFVGLWMAGAWMIFNPFGHAETGGAPIRADGSPASPFTALWWIGQFGYLNWVLFVANLIPALPLDGGRILRPILASRSKDSLIGPWSARSCAVLLAIVGLVRWLYLKRPGSGELFSLAIMIEWMVRVEARAFDERGFFDDGVFGYDFSQGYTSLESGAATVKPPREGAVQKWKRKRSEERRRRLEAERIAEEMRMDDILAKIHLDGRSSLSDEETRFLVQVSDKYKKRAHGP